MHIPSGFVSEQVSVVTALVSVGAIGFCVAKLRRSTQEKPFAFLTFAMVSALIFVAQMLNFGIGGGTSGHFLGALFAATLLGPWAGCLSLVLVLLVQGVLFGDGGMMELGSNILNMGVVGGLLAYPLMQKLRSVLPSGKGGDMASVALASWASVLLASVACSAELALSGTVAASTVFPAMVGTHALIGVGEAVLTVVALHGLSSMRAKSEGSLAMAGLAVAVMLATFVSPFASSFPDGLEKVAQDHGFIGLAVENTASLFADYQVRFVESEALSTGLAGMIGALLVFGFGAVSMRPFARLSSKA